MKFSFDVSEVVTKPISIFSAKDLPKTTRRFEKLLTIIDELGAASAKAQSLRGPITTLLKLKTNPDQRLYLMKEELQTAPLKSETSRDDLYMFNSAGISGFKDLVNAGKYSIVGMLKVGTKNLFVVDSNNRHIEISPLCVLDFYIDEKLQRRGYGKRLQIEFVSPSHLAYDRPSSKFLAFLKKNYNLVDYIPQANNFVIFRQFGLEYLELDSKGRPKGNIFQSEVDAFNNSRKKSESRTLKTTKKEKVKEDKQEKKSFTSIYFKNEMLNDQDTSPNPLAKVNQFNKAADAPIVEKMVVDLSIPVVEEKSIPQYINRSSQPIHSPTAKESSTGIHVEIVAGVEPTPELPEKISKKESIPEDYSDENFEEYLPPLHSQKSSIDVPIDPILEPINWNSKINSSTQVANPRLLSTKAPANPWEMERHSKLMKILSDSQTPKVVPPDQFHQPLTFEQQSYYVSHLKNMNSRPLQKEIYRYRKLNDPGSKSTPHMKN
ncbi:Alpha-tubulin N-acetyltransferase 1 [Terramyces sp. JEL0728]|nr:Alpha-tubulin N-acetyltransferase 1 [Terramyces sp. JEL0728]